MNKTTILKPLELKEDLSFSKKYLQQQATNFFEFFKDFKIDENITFFENFNLLHLDKKNLFMNEGNLFCSYEIH